MVGAWAGIAGIVTVLAADTTRARVPAPRVGDRSWRRWLIAMTLGSAGVGLCLACGLVLISPLRTSTVGAVTAFVAGGFLVIAAAATVLMGELLVLERTDR